jgi:hypothetical protein
MSSRSPSPAARPGSTLGLGEDPATALEAASWALAAMIGTMRDAVTAPLADVLAAAPQRTVVLEAVGLVERSHDGFALHPSLRLGQPFAEAKLNSLRQAFSVAAHDGNSAAGGWGAMTTVAHLKSFGGSQWYTCWYVSRNGQVASAGTFQVRDSGSWTFPMTSAADPHDFRTMEITLGPPSKNGELAGPVILSGQTL